MTASSGTRVAAIQMNCGADVDDNLGRIDSLAHEAASRGAKLALLPENSVFMGRRDEDKLALAESPGNGPLQDKLAGIARNRGLWLIAGSIPLRSELPGRCYGASIVFDDAGRIRATYRKIHLFDVDLPGSEESYRESATMAEGAKPVVVPTPAGRLGLSICYDLRFPELYRRLTEDGASVFTVPAAFTAMTGQAHWETLLRARAIENQAWVIAAAQDGLHPSGRKTYGHSMIVNPWGTVVACLPSGEGIVDACIDSARSMVLRKKFPVLDHRKL